MVFKRYFLLFIGVAFSVLSLSASKEWNAQNVPIPFLQDSTQYVSDPDGLVGKAQKDSANFYLQKLKVECGVQNVLIIVGRVANQDAFRMAQDVGNKYGIGYKKSRRGLVIVIAVEDHKYFIAPGSGLEGELTDVDCDDIARACIVKYMREDAPGEAVASVSRAIYNKVNQPERIYDVVTQFRAGNFLCTSWGGGVVSVKAINQKDSCIEVPKTVTYQGMTYKVDEIEKNAFARHAVLKWLVFPDTRFHVMRGMITGSPHIQSICFRSVEPPIIGNAIWKTKITDVFEAPCFEKVKLMVPKGSLDAYRKSPWGKFRHIEEYE